MKIEIPDGILGEKTIKVEAEMTAASYGSGLLEVFATPAMIALMENVAYNSVNEFLPSGYGTVGIEIQAKHLKATPIGAQVTCRSKLVHVDGKKLFFEIEAEDHSGIIGTATHTRYIIENEEFMKKVRGEK